MSELAELKMAYDLTCDAINDAEKAVTEAEKECDRAWDAYRNAGKLELEAKFRDYPAMMDYLSAVVLLNMEREAQ